MSDISHADNLKRIRRLSTVLKWLVRALAVALPVLGGLPWLFGDQSTIAFMTRLDADAFDLTHAKRAWGFALFTGGTLLASYGLFLLSQLLSRFQKGEFFTSLNIDLLRQFSRAIFLFGFLNTVALNALVSIMTDGEVVAIAIELSDLMIMVISGAFWLASWVLQVGKHMSDEMATVV